jgi:hypothetical protein
MRTGLKTAITSVGCLIWALSIVVAFEAGGRYGSAMGSIHLSYVVGIGHGIEAYLVLAQLPEGSPAELRESLENKIDNALIDYMKFAERAPSRYDYLPMRINPCRNIQLLADHRVAHPSMSKDSERLEAIENSLRILSQASCVDG